MSLTRIDSAFLDLDAIGGINFDVNSNVPTLKVDATNHRVGIGHNSPQYKLDIVGDINVSSGSNFLINGSQISTANINGLQSTLDLKLAASAYTAADVLTKIKTVDGTGSGLDADLLDGVQGSSFLRSDAIDTFNATYMEFGGSAVSSSEGGEIRLTSPSGQSNGATVIDMHGVNLRFFYAASPHKGAYLPLTSLGDSASSRILTTSDEGSGNGLDADTVDGIQASSFLRSDSSDTFNGGTLTITPSNNIRLQDSGNTNNFVDIAIETLNSVARNHINFKGTLLLRPGNTGGNDAIRITDTGSLQYSANGTSWVDFWHAGNSISISNGNAGIGTNNPIYPLHVQESAYFRRGIQVAVLSSNELQTRSPINSGFYNADNTTTSDGWPFTGWAHLLANTHSNTTNYYSQQFASSFFNQELYFRNTDSGNTTASQSWGQVMHTNSTLKPVYAESDGSTGTWSRYFYPGGEYYVDVHGITAPGDMNNMLEQGYYHIANTASNNPTTSYGYLNVHRHAGSHYSLQHFVVSSDTSRQWMRASYPDGGQSSGRNWYQWYSYGALERENQFTNRQHLIGPSSTSTFTGLLANTNSNRAQLVLHSDYSDLVISSAQSNNNHGSTLSFVTSNPSNAADYNKFVINKGNYGTRNQFLEFGFKTSAHSNPHDYVNSTYTTLTLDGSNQRVGIGAGARTPAYPLDVHFAGDSGIRASSSTSHSSLFLNAATGNGSYIRMTAGGSNKFWIATDGSGNLNFRPSGGGTTVKFFNSGEADFYNNTQVYAKLLVQRNVTTGTPSYTQGQIELRTTNNNTPAIGFHRSGYTASTIYESGGRLFINQNSGSDQDGRIVVSSSNYSENLYIRNSGPTLYLRDTNHFSAMLHANSNLLYVLRGGNDSTSWTHNITGRWPLMCNLSNSNVTIGGNGYINGTTSITSDERLKTNIQSITGALEKIKALRGVTFYRTDINQDQLKSGLIAQEVEPILPHIVDETVQQDPDTGEVLEDTRFKCVAYEELHPYLIEAIKEQQATIEALTARIDALESP